MQKGTVCSKAKKRNDSRSSSSSEKRNDSRSKFQRNEESFLGTRSRSWNGPNSDPVVCQPSINYLLIIFSKCCGTQGELQQTFLCFKSLHTELDYWKCPDPYFKYYVACSALLFVMLASIQIILIPR